MFISGNKRQFFHIIYWVNSMNLGSSGGLSLLRVLGSVSKTINIIKQITPIYKDIKPLIEKAPLLFKRLNTVREATYTIKQNLSVPLLESDIDQKKNTNGPVFFR